MFSDVLEERGPGVGSWGELGESRNLSQCDREFPFICFKHLKYRAADSYSFRWGVP